MADKRTELGEIGEFGLIEHINKKFNLTQGSTVKGIGDDAAVIDIGESYMVLTSDLLTEGVHFDLSYMPLKHLGYKSVGVNISDIAAMNAIPKQFIVSIGLSNRFSLEAIDELYEGIRLACDSYNVDMIGGDTTSSAAGLIISISAIGIVDKSKIAYRNKARVNDIICATGDLGGAFMGLQVLEREKQEFMANPNMQPKLEPYEYLVQRQLKPEARMDIIYEFLDKNITPTSMIDISDGLASELLHICKNSGVGIRIYEEKLPIDKRTYDTAVEFNLDPVTCMLNGGEDYELLFTIDQDDYEKIEKHPDIHFIGYVQEKDKGAQLITKQKNIVSLQAQGWKHF